MKITSQEEYGLRCLLRLARAGNGQSLTIPEVASAEGLSTAYVAKLLAVLRQAGLIDSVRGRAGGYRLIAAPDEIHLGAVLRVLGGALFEDPGFCRDHPGTETEICVHLGACTLRALWGTLEHWMRRALDRITLADLVQGEEQVTELLRTRLAEAAQEPPAGLIPLTSLPLTLIEER